MAKFDFVTDRLLVGGDCGVKDELVESIDWLVQNGVTHVIDMRQEWEDTEAFSVHAPEVTYHWIPMDDAGQTEGISTWNQVWEAAEEAFTQPGTKVLVHCHMGINRGPSAAFGILLGIGYQAGEALQMIRNARSIAAIAYWRDVLNWYFLITKMEVEGRQLYRRQSAAWMADNKIDVRSIIRGIRDAERGTVYR